MNTVLKNVLPVKFTLGEGEIGLVFNHKQFVKVIGTGKHTFSRFNNDYSLKIPKTLAKIGVQQGEEMLRLLKKYPQAFEEVATHIATSEDEVALVSCKGVLVDAILPAQEGFLWTHETDYAVERVQIGSMIPIEADLARQLRHKNTVRKTLLPHLAMCVVPEHCMGLQYVDGKFIGTLPTGEYAWWTQGEEVQVDIIDFRAKNSSENYSFNYTTVKWEKISTEDNAIQYHEDVLQLAKTHSDAFGDVVTLLRTTENQVAFVYQDGLFLDVLAPACEGFVWQNEHEYRVDYHDISDNDIISAELWKVLKQDKIVFTRLYSNGFIAHSTVPSQHVGLHYVDKQFKGTLPTGEYAWWTLGSRVTVEEVDMRLQNMEVSGQEILTQDRVSIRLNLLATWQVVDAEKLVLNVKGYNDFLYREMQLALRTVVATKTLDELLADKNLLNSEVKTIVAPIAEAQGISVQSVGVKDVILPGEMKEILSKVVEAQKTAEANIIKRREETQATRSLHNTAKVMENNPVLLRLKELESLEKITSQISELNVYGGMDGLMNGLVDLRTEKKT